MPTLVSATLPQAMQLLKLVADKNLPLEELQRRMDSGIVSDVFDSTVDWDKVNRDIVRVALGLKKLVPDPVVTELVGVILPEESRTIDDRIADGVYSWFNNDITAERFPLTLAAGPQPLFTVWFQRDVKSEYVEQWAAANGYEVALIDDLLAVGSHSEHKELQRQFPIIALGSSTVVDGDVYVPSLARDGSGRLLLLACRDDEWRGDCRFLLRKVSGSLAT